MSSNTAKYFEVKIKNKFSYIYITPPKKASFRFMGKLEFFLFSDLRRKQRARHYLFLFLTILFDKKHIDIFLKYSLMIIKETKKLIQNKPM